MDSFLLTFVVVAIISTSTHVDSKVLHETMYQDDRIEDIELRSNTSAEAEPRFFLGEKGKLECAGGVPVKVKATCEIGCAELELTVGSDMSDGFLCFQKLAKRGKGTGQCKQNGNNGGEARLICKKQL